MKRLYIMRHAKSDWNDIRLADFDRPLNERGLRDAPIMVQKFIDKGYTTDCILSSPANRAKSTAQFFIDKFSNAPNYFIKNLYHGEIIDIFNACSEVDDSINNVMVFCHNPGITYYANLVCNANIDNVPTAGILCIDADIESWKNISNGHQTLIDFLYPKM